MRISLAGVFCSPDLMVKAPKCWLAPRKLVMVVSMRQGRSARGAFLAGVALAALGSGVPPAVAAATTTASVGTYNAGKAGKIKVLVIRADRTSTTARTIGVQFVTGAYYASDSAGIAPGKGCALFSLNQVKCARGKIAGVITYGTNGDDFLGIYARRKQLVRVYGFGGADEIQAGAKGGPAFLFGGGGPDLIKGNGSHALLAGGGGPDHLFGGEGRDRLFGGKGIDVLDAKWGPKDTDLKISCGPGDDKHERAKVDKQDPQPVGC